MYLLIAYFVAAIISYGGYRAGALTASGAMAACLVGGTIFGFGGLAGAVMLMLFFATSSLLSFFKAADRRKQQAAETFEKGGKRDAAQVLANGGIAALAAVLVSVTGGALASICLGAFTGALAAATADTWATEIGVLSKRQPRMIITGKPVAPGTSGGVTPLGTGAALAGALLIGLAAALLFQAGIVPGAQAGPIRLILAGLIGGTGGMLADSLVGATLQAGYTCPRCGTLAEGRRHVCGATTLLTRGLSWVNNDVVNVAGTLAGALLGALSLFLT